MTAFKIIYNNDDNDSLTNNNDKNIKNNDNL